MKIKIFSFLLLTSMFVACNKEKLEPIPQTSLTEELSFKDETSVIQLVNGMYAGLKSGQMYAGRYQVYQDVRGEEFLNRTNNAVTAWLTWLHNLTASANEVQSLWSSAYNTINRANVLIDGVANAPISAASKAQYIAEAKFVRATSYFMLLQLYARPYTDGAGNKPGVILRLTPQTTFGDNDKARATVAQVYEQIIKDLNEAEADLPANYTTATLRVTRAHKATAIALKSRVYLNMGLWGNVITEGNKLVPNAAPFTSPLASANSLNPSVTNVYTSYTNSEVILSMPFTALNTPGTQNGLGWYYNPGPNGGGEFGLNTTNGIVANAGWRAQDARRGFITVVSGVSYLTKWPGPNNAADWNPVIRYAEVMLNLSEALARNAQGTSVDARALAILNAIRKRSDPTIADFAPATKDELVNLILTERRIELLGEGFRTSDITRTGSSFPAKGTVSAIAPAANQYVWPISIAELLVNKLCEQNTGY